MDGKLLFRFELSKPLKKIAGSDDRIYLVREIPGREDRLAIWWAEESDFYHKIYATSKVNKNVGLGDWIKLDDTE